MNMQLHIEYAWVTNQIFNSLSSTVQMFQSSMSDACSSLCI